AAEEGDSSVPVTITDVGGSTATAWTTAAVADAPLTVTTLPVHGVTVAAPEQGDLTGVMVATFTTADLHVTADAFTAKIDWGDGSDPTSGTVAGGNGSFTVSGTHPLAPEPAADHDGDAD